MHRRVLGPVVAACLALVGTLGVAVPARAASDAELDTAIDHGAAWLAQQQLPDGSFGVNTGLDPGWALLALAGAGRHPADLRPAVGAPSAQDGQLAIWTVNDPADWWAFSTEQATDWERAILQAHAAGLQPTRLSAQRNLLAGLAPWYRDGWFTSQASVFNHTIFGLLALSALPVPQALLDRSARIVAANQHDDGGYTSYPATDPVAQSRGSDIDSTGAAVAALCAAGRTLADPAVADGIALLRSRRSPNGAIGNVDSTSWALSGLGQCGLRRGAPGWTAADETTVDWLLAGQFAAGTDAGAWASGSTPNAYATADALRALGAAGFLVAPPARAVGGDPLVRPAPSVANGTVVPVALVIDAGRDRPRLCATEAPVGATVAAVLDAARIASQPAGCVSALTLDGDLVERIDGAAGGGWRARLDGGAESAAGPQPVGFGQIVSLRLDDPDPLVFDAERIDFGPAPLGLLGSARRLELRNAGAAPLTVRGLRLVGDDFVISSQECRGETLVPEASCTVGLRFAPSAIGARTASLNATVAGSSRTVALPLTGVGEPLPTGPPGPMGAQGADGPTGARGSDGAAGVAGTAGTTGAKGAQGTPGPSGARGSAAAERRVTCKLTQTRRARLRCRVAVRGSSSCRRARSSTARARCRTTPTRRPAAHSRRTAATKPHWRIAPVPLLTATAKGGSR